MFIYQSGFWVSVKGGEEPPTILAILDGMNFYLTAEKILKDRRGSIESQIFSQTIPLRKQKRLYALISQTLKYREFLQEIISNSKILENEKRLNPTIALLLIHDFLLGKGIEAGGGPLKQSILRHRSRLHAEYVKAKLRRKIKNVTEIPISSLSIKWARWNTIKGPPTLITTEVHSLEDVREGKHFHSPTIPNVYAFHANESLNASELYKDGRIFLQNLASCFPAFILSPKPGQTIIDACAAPGNKTTHLAALMTNEGSVVAYEKNASRTAILKTMVKKAGASIVTARNEDFLLSAPRTVDAILLDPSCSGSGITSRLNYDEEEENLVSTNEVRFHSLADFQLRVLCHAMRYDCARIVYSTCSFHQIENELVVAKALASPIAAQMGWKSHKALPHWPRRGQSEDPILADNCIRCTPEDNSIGFFVALFTRCTTK